jgi:hypothetical protein
LGEDQKLKLPRFLEDEEKDPEATKQVRMAFHILLDPLRKSDNKIVTTSCASLWCRQRHMLARRIWQTRSRS